MRAPIPLTAVVAALLAGALAAPGTADAASCPLPRGAKLQAASSGGRVYLTRTGGMSACSFAYGRRVRLDRDTWEVHGPFSINRRWVVYVMVAFDGESRIVEVEERSLRTGRARFKTINGECFENDEGTQCGDATIGSLVLKPNGSVAWIACEAWDTDSEGECLKDVKRTALRHDSRGRSVLDAGRLRPRSMRLARDGHGVSWIHNGHRKTAALR